MWFGWYCVIGLMIVVFTRKTVMQEVMDEIYESMPLHVDYAWLYMMGACFIAVCWLPILLYGCRLVWKYNGEVDE
ncbi:TPA: hypothetical protein QCR51_005624 [Bacillus cereus]|nr:hypothetical protein [Bacillus cereus]